MIDGNRGSATSGFSGRSTRDGSSGPIYLMRPHHRKPIEPSRCHVMLGGAVCFV
jgi:hypothetical protein